MHVKLTLLLTNSMQTKQQINKNENLEKISLPEFTGGDIFIIGDNPNLKKLCASKFDGGAVVCIGNNQPFLDADLSGLVNGELDDPSSCFDSNATTICGPDNGLGLFSSPSNRCPSNACMMPPMHGSLAVPDTYFRRLCPAGDC